MKPKKIAALMIILAIFGFSGVFGADQESAGQRYSVMSKNEMGKQIIKALAVSSDAPGFTITIRADNNRGSQSTSSTSGRGNTNISFDKIANLRLTIEKGEEEIFDSKISLLNWAQDHSKIIDELKNQLKNKGLEVKMEQDPSDKEKLIINIRSTGTMENNEL